MAPPFALHKCSALITQALSYKTWTGFQDYKVYWIKTNQLSGGSPRFRIKSGMIRFIFPLKTPGSDLSYRLR